MRLEIRYRPVDECESVHAFYLEGPTVFAIAARAIREFGAGRGVYDYNTAVRATAFDWEHVYDGSSYYIEVYGLEEEEQQ